LNDARDVLVAHRRLLKDKIVQGFLRFFPLGYINMDRLFSTIGLNGLYECLEVFGLSIFSEQGKALSHWLLNEIKSFSHQASQETGTPFNIEQVPAESLAIKLAAKDKELYGMEYEIYSNQFVPLWVDCDVVDRIKIDGELSKSLTGGGISHLNVGERLTSPDQMKSLINYAIRSGCEHFAVNYNFCRCVNGHITIAGILKKCPLCGDPVADYLTRIVGYMVPVSAWNKGRQIEHKSRIFKKNIQDVPAKTSETDIQGGA
jgi:ribonucleoside-triphosphate reductase